MIKSSLHSRRTILLPTHDFHLSRRNSVALRPAFTLIEMLISTALVMMIMTMFAQIYGTAINTMSMQRTMANNDQKARTVNNLLLSDLRARTYRQAGNAHGTAKGLVPLVAEEVVRIDQTRQRGYFYYSENDPENDTDDVLQFTAALGNSLLTGEDLTNSSNVFLGKATYLGGSVINQPDSDDLTVNNGISESSAAEIAYFVRGGNLYRRLLLLRNTPDSDYPEDSQPRNSTTGDRVPGTGAYTYGSGNFWSDFDYSATREYDPVLDATYLWFNGYFSLKNEPGHTGTNKPIALPWNRFGHYNNKTAPISIHHGSPREFVGPARDQFIGRFTAEETSYNVSPSNMMGWPGTNTPRFNKADTSFTLNVNKAITSLAGGDRISEDLLLTNVEAFNIEYWDDTSSNPQNHGFYSLGAQVPQLVDSRWRDQTVPGQITADKNQYYGPHIFGAGKNRVFDTWHPEAMTTDGTDVNRLPPRFPLTTDSLAPAMKYASWADLPNSVPEGTVFFLPSHNNGTLYYKAIRAGFRYPRDPMNIALGPLVAFDSTPGSIIQETDGDPATTDGVVWQCMENRIGMKGIRITIRFRDPGKEAPRQVTLIHSFVE